MNENGHINGVLVNGVVKVLSLPTAPCWHLTSPLVIETLPCIALTTTAATATTLSALDRLLCPFTLPSCLFSFFLFIIPSLFLRFYTVLFPVIILIVFSTLSTSP